MTKKKKSVTEVSPPQRDESPAATTSFATSADSAATTNYFAGRKSLLTAPAEIPISYPEDEMLSFEWVHNLMSSFDWSSRNLPPSEFPSVFPVDVFDTLVLIASKILHKEPNCVRIDSLDQDSSVVVVGDVHGQLHDTLFLLQDAGFPSENRFFVFNGDYVDRGAWGLETFLVLLAWKVCMPHKVYLLRGNHESKYCTSVYGFEKEVMIKFGDKVFLAPHHTDPKERRTERQFLAPKPIVYLLVRWKN